MNGRGSLKWILIILLVIFCIGLASQYLHTLVFYYRVITSENESLEDVVLSRQLLNPERLGKCGPIHHSRIRKTTKNQIKSNQNINASQECIHIVTSATKSYLTALLASINSIQQHTTRTVFFHVVTTTEDLPLFKSILPEHSLSPLEVIEFKDTRLRPLIRVWENDRYQVYYNTINYARFYMPIFLPDVSEVIYIDPDTIVMGDVGDLIEIFTRREDERRIYLAAVESRTTKTHPKSFYCFLVNCDDPEISKLITENNKFFNAGVFVTDLQRWREENVTEQLEYWMRENTKRPLYIWGSQAPLSLVFYNRWLQLPFEWNERRARKRFLREKPIDAKIYHFTSDFKPWMGNGKGSWQLWCPYYPYRNKLWFCQETEEERFNAVFPASPMDYRFLSLKESYL